MCKCRRSLDALELHAFDRFVTRARPDEPAVISHAELGIELGSVGIGRQHRAVLSEYGRLAFSCSVAEQESAVENAVF